LSIKQKLIRKLYKGDNKLILLDQSYLPRWIVILLDVVLCIISLIVVYFILTGLPLQFHEIISIYWQGAIILIVNLLFFAVFKTYAGIIRHSTFTDIIKLAFSSLATAISLLVFNYGYEIVYGEKIYLSTSLVFYMLVSFTVMLLFRIVIKETYQFMKNITTGNLKKKVAIVGVDDHTISIGKAITTESNLPFKLVGFLTENFVSKRFKILGKPVFPIENNFAEVVSGLDLDGVIIISESFTGKERN